MNIDKFNAFLQREDGLSRALGMEFLSTPEPDTCKARMKVDGRNRQPYGFLSGGASLALAENLAGVGSMALLNDEVCVGISVSGKHLRSVKEGDTVTAYGKLMFKGKTLHEWRIDIKNEKEELISTVQVTNYVIHAKKDE